MPSDRRLKVALLELPLPRFSVQPVDYYPPLARAYLKAMAHARGPLADCDVVLPPAAIRYLPGEHGVLTWLLSVRPHLLGLSLLP
ncbi:MAG: hypothetical protein AB1486_30150 [Planctomycetota bacterium]